MKSLAGKFVGIGLMGLLGVSLMTLASVDGNRGFVRSEDNPYIILLNKSNSRLQSTSGSFSAVTKLGNNVSFSYSNCKTDVNYWGILNGNGQGSLENTSNINGIRAITVSYEGTTPLKVLYGVDSNINNGYLTIQNNARTEFAANYFRLFTLDNSEDIKINSIMIEYSCVEAHSNHTIHGESIDPEDNADFLVEDDGQNDETGDGLIIAGYKGDGGQVIIPAYIGGEPVTGIDPDAFTGNNTITSIEVPGTINRIDDYTFYECENLESVKINEGVKEIGEWAFTYDYSLTDVEIPDTVESIGFAAFGACYSIESIHIPDSVKYLGKEAFAYCHGLTTFDMPDSVVETGDCLFYGCDNLVTVNLSDNLAYIDQGYFYQCNSLRTIKIPSKCEFIGKSAFLECYNLQSVDFSDCENLKEIKEYAFYSCQSMRSVTLPNCLTSIGDGVFNDCTRLRDVYIPQSVTSIGEYAFYGCPSNLTISCGATKKPSGWDSTWNYITSNKKASVKWGIKK